MLEGEGSGGGKEWEKKVDGKSEASKKNRMEKASLSIKRLYALKEAACYLGRSDWGMRELIWARKIPVVREGRKIFLDIQDLNDFVTRNKSLYS